MLVAKRADQRVDIDDRSARRVDQARARLHARQFRLADHLKRLRRLGDVQRHDVRDLQQLVERRRRARVAERQLGLDVVVEDAHPERLGKQADLRADVPVPDDSERLAADLVRPGGGLQPAAAMRAGVPRRECRASAESLSAITSSATLRVLENGALKTGMPRSRAHSRSTWLVPMQKHPTPMSRGAASKMSAGELGGRADTDEVGVADRLAKLRRRERLRVVLDSV